MACVTLRASVELGLPSGALACLWSALVLCALLALGAERPWREPVGCLGGLQTHLGLRGSCGSVGGHVMGGFL